MHLVLATLTGGVQSTFLLTGTPTCSNSNASPLSTAVRKGSTASMDSLKSAWKVRSVHGQEISSYNLILSQTMAHPGLVQVMQA